VVCGATAAGASVFYGIGPGTASPYGLYQIAPGTGTGTVVGPISYIVGAMDVAPNGTLFSDGLDLLLNHDLLTLNRSTGAATLVAPISGIPFGLSANDFAFRPDGTLFSIYGLNNIYTINTTTGAAAFVGHVGGNTIAFSSAGTLYLADGVSLYTVDQSTAAMSLLIALTFDSSFGLSGTPQMHMTFDPSDGALYAIVYGNGSSSLGTINIGTGAVTRIGPTVSGMGPLAIATPEPSSWLFFMTGLCIVGGWRWRIMRPKAALGRTGTSD